VKCLIQRVHTLWKAERRSEYLNRVVISRIGSGPTHIKKGRNIYISRALSLLFFSIISFGLQSFTNSEFSNKAAYSVTGDQSTPTIDPLPILLAKKQKGKIALLRAVNTLSRLKKELLPPKYYVTGS
jgi:hypothetical protein